MTDSKDRIIELQQKYEEAQSNVHRIEGAIFEARRVANEELRNKVKAEKDAAKKPSTAK